MMIKDDHFLSKISIKQHSYEEINPSHGDVVYLDPPYNAKSNFSSNDSYASADEFDFYKFYEWAKSLDVPVFMSESNRVISDWVEVR